MGLRDIYKYAFLSETNRYNPSISPLEHSETDRVLLHLQCNSQKISDFLRSRGAIRAGQERHDTATDVTWVKIEGP